MPKLDLRRPGVIIESVKTQKAILPALRRNAKKMGYALTIHGSQLRDIDLVAIPWTENAICPKQFFRYIFKVVQIVNPKGTVFMLDRGKIPFEEKPHGRLSRSINIGWHTYIDLSIMPRLFKRKQRT